MTTRKPNIYDVAKHAGVSHQTVSRVINNHPNIRQSTQEKVLAAMQELGYTPNLAARALVTARSQMIGILAADTYMYGPSGMLHAIENEARKFGYATITCSVDTADESSISDGIEHLRRSGIEGLIAIIPHREAVDFVRSNMVSIPIVSIDSHYRLDELSASIDNFQGAALATKHLIELGHKNIAHISGPANWIDSQDRAAGYTATMLNAGLKPLVIQGDWEIGTGYRLATEIKFAERGITAVFAANDHLAFGVMRACQEQGLNVPVDLSVVGFDDIPEAAFWNPALTTLRQDFAGLGDRAISLLLSNLSGEGKNEAPNPMPEFVLRSSTSPLQK